MANQNDKNKPGTETALQRPEERAMSVPGTFDPSEFERFIGEGFASIETVLFGPPAAGKLPFYVGELIGPGDPIEVGDEDKETGERNRMPTWAFHPIAKVGTDADGKSVYGAVQNVTHVVPCSYMVDAACKRIMKEMERQEATATVGVWFIEKKEIPGRPRMMNRYRIFERYVPKSKG